MNCCDGLRRIGNVVLLLVMAGTGHLRGGEPGRGTHGIVASVHPLATRAGIETMRAGGNAIDAAVAVGLTLGVVDGHNSGIGGGCFMLMRLADGRIVALDGREMAPAAATQDMFVRDGKAETGASQDGALAAAVPGALAVFEKAVRAHGRRRFAELILPAAGIAEEGFLIDFVYARKLKASAERLARFEGACALFFKGDGVPLAEGELLRQAELARSYRAIAAEGVGWFYRGAYAATVAAWMKKNGGIITAEDFENYVVKERQSFRTTYRGSEVVCFPPPSSGGVHVAQTLNILENFDIRALAPDARAHVMAEALKLVFADRAHWLGDPDFADVPRGLVDKGYARELAGRIDPDKVTAVGSHGMPPEAETRLFEKHTTHFSAADADGNWVACTATINTPFGSKVIVPGTGILLNNQMDDFSIQPGVPNSFKLVGGEANAVAPRKRPLSSMSPTIVLKDGRPFLALGGSGGPTIISQTVLNLVGVLDLGLGIDQALAQPRIHHQWQPDQLRIEQEVPAGVRAALEARGHTLAVVPSFGASQIVGRPPEGAGFVGASDPRAGGTAEGW